MEKSEYIYRERYIERDRRRKGEVKEEEKNGGGRLREKEEGREKEKLTRMNVFPSE